MLGATVNILEIPETASSSGCAALGLCAPVEGSLLGIRVTARRPARLLNVVRSESASSAESVGLVVATTERICSLCHVSKQK